MEAIQRITAVGLLAIPADPEDVALVGDKWPFHHIFRIYKPSNSDTNSSLIMSLGERIPIEGPRIEIYLPKGDSTWIMRVQEYIPGPGSSDFICAFPHLDAAIDATLDFHDHDRLASRGRSFYSLRNGILYRDVCLC